MGYLDVMNMPTYERRFYIGRLIQDYDKEKEEYEKVKNKSTKR